MLAPRPSTSFACSTGQGPVTAFPDVPADSVHAPAIECAAGYGIAGGRTDGSYGPAETVSRDQMAAFVARTLEVAGVTLPQEPADAFTDDETSTHEPSIDKAATAGLAAGSGGGYAPERTVRRDQMATFVARLLDRVQRDAVATLTGDVSAASDSVQASSAGPEDWSPARDAAGASLPAATTGIPWVVPPLRR